MTADLSEESHAEQLKPVWRAFVLRPAFIASVPAAVVGAATFFFWHPLQWLVGRYVLIAPALATIAVLATFLERSIRYGKTRYEIRPDRIVVETGTLFRERSVELDLHHITLVEWNSPFVLRTFYDAGHITLQEAGSAEKPAHLACIAEPERIYQRIADLMSARGFSMRRKERIREEQPGHLGAAVDLAAQQMKLFWIVALVILQSLPESLTLLVGDGPSLLQLVVGNYDVFAGLVEPAVFARIRTGTILLGGAAALFFPVWLTTLYLDYYRRTYTLFDDVIDYVDGFLNETRRFIPLENLADTRVSRPIHKRLLGLSDVTLSSQGAENDVVFESTPNGPAFAESVERLVDRTRDLEHAPDRDVPSDDATRDDTERAGTPRRDVHLTMAPSWTRAALRGLDMLPGFVLFTAVLSIPFALAGGIRLDYGVLTVTSAVGFALLASVLAVATMGFRACWSMVQAAATEFAFDGRGAHHTFDLISKTEKRFALERITSISVIRSPLDWIAGTMKLRFRSIGSDEDIEFWGIEHTPEILAPIREALGLTSTAAPEQTDDLTPNYTVSDGLGAFAPVYAAATVAVAGGGIVATQLALPHATFITAAVASAALLAAALHQGFRALYHSRIHGHVESDFIHLEEGILRTYRHFAPLQHVKALESLRYPGSDAGRLTFKTAGFPIEVAHHPDVASAHESIDRRLGLEAADAHGHFVAVEPGAGTQAIRWSWTLLVGAGVVMVPYVFAYYRRMDYTVEPGRLVADGGIYFDRRTTILFERVDHIESSRIFAHWFTDSHDIRVFTVGSRECDLVFRSVPRANDTLALIRRRLASVEDPPGE